MKYKWLFAALLAVSSFCQQSVAQAKRVVISGVITSADPSSPLEGVVVTEKGTNNTTGTMPDGQFSLEVLLQDTIIVHLDGYETKRIKITEETWYPIILKQITSPQKAEAKIN
jgi:hypothetical protein